MTSIQEQFQKGSTAEEYQLQMTQNRERFAENERTVSLVTEDVQFFTKLPDSLHVIVLTEDWCEAAIANVPVLVRLAIESDKLDLRFFLRDQHQELMNQYLKNGVYATIPAFIFFDPAFHEIGRWYEMPAKVRDMRVEFMQELFSTDPAFAGIPLTTPIPELPDTVRMKLFQTLKEFRLRTRVFADHEVVREIREIIWQGVALGVTPARKERVAHSV
jgi:thioredoxin family protein